MKPDKTIHESIVIETTSQGYPYFPPDKKLNLQIQFSEDGKQVDFAGNSESLRRLGEVLIGLSHSKSYHIHLDNEEVSPIRIWPEDMELILNNSD